MAKVKVLTANPAIGIPTVLDTSTDSIDGTAYTQVTKNGGSVLGARTKLNFIEGANVTIGVADNSGTDSLDITLSATGGGGGSVATDTIFDAKGDLPVGTGADTAAKLSVGTNGQAVLADSSQATGLKYGNVLCDVQSFSASGTWTKPAGAKFVEVIVIGGGGSGGSGRKGAAGSSRSGGGGGAAGGRSQMIFNGANLPSTVSVTVPAAAVGGAAQTANSTNGNAGSPGGTCSFGNYLKALGGGAGGGGTTSASTGGTLASGFTSNSGTGGTSPSGGGNGNNGAQGAYTSGSGGGGGAIGLGNTTNSGGAGGGNTAIFSSVMTGGSGGAAGSNGSAGTGDDAALLWGGGGGGGTANGGNGGAGGAGSFYGAGGGGGGASVDSVGDSGAGGNGAPGFVLVVSYF